MKKNDTTKPTIRKKLSNIWNWYVITPYRDLRTHSKDPSKSDSGESSIFRLLFAALTIGTLIMLPTLSLDAGISGDEGRCYIQAEESYQYYATGGKDKSAVTRDPGRVDSGHYIGQSFDLIALVLEKTFKVEDPYQLRHTLNALTGWLAIFFAALFIARIAGYRAACLTLFLLFISPRFLGHSYNNNKDIPVVTAFVVATYFMMTFFRDFPRRTICNAWWITAALAFGISLRISSILLVPYFGLFAGLYFLTHNKPKEYFSGDAIKMAGKLLLAGCSILVAGYLLGILLWPFALEAPIANAMVVLKEMSNLGVSITQIFEGEQLWSNQIPWYYNIKYMAITIPAVIFTGAVLFIFLSRRITTRKNALPLFILIFSWLFPIVYAACNIQNDYGGWRHLMFTYPYLVGLAALGFDATLTRLNKPAHRYIATGIFLVLCFHPLSHIIRNHPHEYVYFNEIFGGVDKANGYYETDYYQHSIRAASEWLENHLADELTAGETFVVGKNDGPVHHYLRHLKDQIRVQHTYGYYTRGKYDWDYGIFYTGYISPHQLRNGYWPPAGTIHSIMVDNTPVCAIVKRPSKEDFMGYEALKSNDVNRAIGHFETYLIADPKNESVHGALASTYLSKGDFNKVLLHAGKALEFYPESTGAMDAQGRAHIQLKNYDLAIESFTQLAKRAPAYPLPYYFMAVAYMNKGNPDAAIQMGNEAVRRDPRFVQAYQLVASAYQQKGNTRAAQAYSAQAQKIQAAGKR
jgi:hypothetical protein